MVTPETNQPPHTLCWANIIRMSRESNIRIEVKMEGGSTCEGIAMARVTFSDNFLYLRTTIGDNTEFHMLVNLEKVVYLSFGTEPGFLDNLIE